MTTIDRFRPDPQPLDADWSAETLQQIFASDPTPSPRPRRALAAIGAAAAVATAALVSTTLGTSAAYAVDERADGDVIVTIHRFTDAPGLEAALADHGIDADVTYLRAGVPSDLDDGSTPCSGGEPIGVTVDPGDGGGFVVTFERGYLDAHDGAELSLTAAGGDAADAWAGLRWGWSDGRC